MNGQTTYTPTLVSLDVNSDGTLTFEKITGPDSAQTYSFVDIDGDANSRFCEWSYTNGIVKLLKKEFVSSKIKNIPLLDIQKVHSIHSINSYGVVFLTVEG